MNKLQPLIEEYLHAIMDAGLVRDQESQLLPPDYFPDIVMMMMQEEMNGRITAGLAGYALAKGFDIMETGVLIPRELQLACLELVRPYATIERPDLIELVSRCEKSDALYLTDKEIAESGATNVRTLH